MQVGDRVVYTPKRNLGSGWHGRATEFEGRVTRLGPKRVQIEVCLPVSCHWDMVRRWVEPGTLRSGLIEKVMVDSPDLVELQSLG